MYCGGHSTDAEWDAWHGECQWCGEFDVEWEEKEDVDDGDEMDEWEGRVDEQYDDCEDDW